MFCFTKSKTNDKKIVHWITNFHTFYLQWMMWILFTPSRSRVFEGDGGTTVTRFEFPRLPRLHFSLHFQATSSIGKHTERQERKRSSKMQRWVTAFLQLMDGRRESGCNDFHPIPKNRSHKISKWRENWNYRTKETVHCVLKEFRWTLSNSWIVRISNVEYKFREIFNATDSEGEVF